MPTPPNLSIAIEMVAASDPGRIRDNNEDSVLIETALGLAVLADGMGGYNAGEVASSMATAALGRDLARAFHDCPPQAVGEDAGQWVRTSLTDTINTSNAAIFQAAQDDPRYAGMGTTLVAVQFFDNRLMVAHIGDSRLYRWRDGCLTVLTRDHSILQAQIDSGLITPAEARRSTHKNLVTRALGVEPTVDIELNEFPTLTDDVYLLCSDGLNDMVEDDDIELTLASLAANLPLCAQQLIDLANDNGGRDNVSVVVARIRQSFPALSPAAGWKGCFQSLFG